MRVTAQPVENVRLQHPIDPSMLRGNRRETDRPRRSRRIYWRASIAAFAILGYLALVAAGGCVVWVVCQAAIRSAFS